MIAALSREWRRLLCAIQLMTRLPVPRFAWSDDAPARASRYFPLAGLLVGGLSALVLIAARQVWPQGVLPALLATAAGVAITGALHEDGLADTADGLGGGRDPARRLEIMKDSRIGVYGALALGLTLAIKVVALGVIASTATAVAALLCAQAGGRAACVLVMWRGRYVTDAAQSRLSAGTYAARPVEAIVALVIALAPFLLLPPWIALVCAGAGLAAAAVPALAARRLVDGYTGDVLGAVEQAFELGVILAAAALA